MKPGWRVRRFADGTGLVARRTGRAFVPLDPAGDVRLLATAVRCGAGLWAAPRALDLMHQQPTWLTAATGIYCLAAWRAGDPNRDGQLANEGAAEGGTTIPLTDATPTTDPGAEFLRLLHRLMPHPGDRIHLVQVAAEMSGDPTTTGPVRELCAAAGIPITTVRVRGRGPSTGIYRRDVPPLPAPSGAPLPAVVGGPDQQQQQQQQSVVAAREGFVTLDDPANPARSTVHWIKETA